ncbi:MAG: hypothetical protein V3V13_04625 [Paracoccaceae bacterium]
MFKAGDIVHFHSKIAAKGKYHLCISTGCLDGVHAFLFINSEHKYEGDCVFDDGVILGLAKSRTGSTVVGFSQIVRVKVKKMALWKPAVRGTASKAVIQKLLEHANKVQSLNRKDRKKVIDALSDIIMALD